MTAEVIAIGAGESELRSHLRRKLNAHMSELGYKTPRVVKGVSVAPEIVRRNAARGRIAYGETVLRSDLKRRSCRERLVTFSKRRTRRRSTILFFIGVAESQQEEVEHVLEELGIVSSLSGGHVQVVSIPLPD
jgi:hypothetical protein